MNGLLAILLAAALAVPAAPVKIRSWVCFYGADFPSQQAPTADLFVLNRLVHPDLAPLHARGSRVVAYVSIGEINRADPLFARVPRRALVEENPDWKGAFRVRMKSPQWQRLVLEQMIPDALAQGFDGVFLDTVDVAQYLEQEKKISGSVDAAVRFISEIRRRFPKITIVMNNGLFLADRVGGTIDALVVEDVFTLYDAKTRAYHMAPDAWTQERLAAIKTFQGQFAKPVLSLDYLSEGAAADIRLVEQRALAAGLVPYIADIGLQTVFFHPSAGRTTP